METIRRLKCKSKLFNRITLAVAEILGNDLAVIQARDTEGLD